MPSRPFLTMLSPSDAAALQANLTEHTAPPGTVLIRGGAPGTSVLLLLSGRVKVMIPAVAGRDVLVGLIGPGDLVGELGAVDGRSRSADTVAVETVRYGSLSTADFDAFLEQRPMAARAFMRLLADRMRRSDEELKLLATDDTLGQIASRLAQLAWQYGRRTPQGVQLDLPITQDELMGWTGASRDSVAQALASMSQLGWIATDGRSLTVRDAEALERRVGAGQDGRREPARPAPRVMVTHGRFRRRAPDTTESFDRDPLPVPPVVPIRSAL